MIGASMSYAVAVGGLLGLAALAFERVASTRGWACRGIWAAAMSASVVVPAMSLARVRSGPSRALTRAAPADAEHSVEVIAAVAAVLRPALEVVEPYLLPSWLACSLLLGLALAGGLHRLHAVARLWPEATVVGRRVLVSRDFGPAVVGIVRSRIVVPRWMLASGRERLDLALLHEEEHRAAGDVRLLFSGILAVVVLPWNPALWWQLRRLRAAVELDCDSRVLGRGVARASYGALLLETAQGPSRAVLPLAALTTATPLLERRLQMIGRGANRMGRLTTGAVCAGALTVVAIACEATPPTDLRSEANERPAAIAPAAGTAGEGTGQAVEGVLRLRAETEPLIYIDGIRVEGESSGAGSGEATSVLEELDPDEIERIEIVKGEAARSLFGPEAANGVIQIFLKR